MINSNSRLNSLDVRISGFLNKNGIFLLRYSLGIIFIWFGALKPFGLSPATELVKSTMSFFPFINVDIFIAILGLWEVLIGLTLIIRTYNRIAILLLFSQMAGTILPVFLLPHLVFTKFPFVLTLEGQYIVKNLVLISAGIVIGGMVREKSETQKL